MTKKQPTSRSKHSNNKSKHSTVKFYNVGFKISGEPKQPRALPKRRLSNREARVLLILKTNLINTPEKALEMREIFKKYQESYASDSKYDGALCSDNLEKLQQSWFVSMIAPIHGVVNKATEAIRPKRKARFWLSDKAQTSEVSIDADLWVTLNGLYIASEKTRIKTRTSSNAA